MTTKLEAPHKFVDLILIKTFGLKINSCFIFYFFLLVNWQSDNDQIENIRKGRYLQESELTNPSAIVKKYLKRDYISFDHKNKNYDLYRNLNIVENIISKLLQSNLEIRKPNPDEQLSYKLLLHAYSLSETTNNNVLKCEVLKNILSYLIFTNNNKRAFYQYLDIHLQYSWFYAFCSGFCNIAA